MKINPRQIYHKAWLKKKMSKHLFWGRGEGGSPVWGWNSPSFPSSSSFPSSFPFFLSWGLLWCLAPYGPKALEQNSCFLGPTFVCSSNVQNQSIVWQHIFLVILKSSGGCAGLFFSFIQAIPQDIFQAKPQNVSSTVLFLARVYVPVMQMQSKI